VPALIDALIKQKLITREQLKDARDKQLGAKRPIQELLVEMGFVKEKDIMYAASDMFGMEICNLNNVGIDGSVMRLISYDTAKHYGVCPIGKEGHKLIVAMSNPQDVLALDHVQMFSMMEVKPVLCSMTAIGACIENYYQIDDALYDILKNVTDTPLIKKIKSDGPEANAGEDKVAERKHVSTVQLVSLILCDAVRARASDIHIEPQERSVIVRYRIDGYLKTIMRIPNKFKTALASRIKVLAELNIAETKKPQDGRIRVEICDKKIDLRISVLPTFYGETIVARLLDMQQARTTMDTLGFSKKELQVFKEAVRRSQGLVLVTGPTGSGKTSTLYAALNYIKDETKNIVTIEDPVEYLIDGVNQTQINPVKDISFATGLRSVLRQDPNVILIGEIRDYETAEITFKSSLTGHLVLSTLHTNSAAAAITRLYDIGLEPYLISSSVILILAQRLIRKLCPHCKTACSPSKDILDKYKTYIDEYNISEFFEAKGCEHCRFTGFLDRVGIFELLPLDERIKQSIMQKASENEILQYAINKGLTPLIKSGIEKVAQGITSLEEIDAAIGQDIQHTGSCSDTIESENAKILVVDDEDDVRKTIKKRLNTAGFDIIEARDGLEAIEQAFKKKPDLIVMDVMMPEMDGFETTRKLKATLETAHIPIMLLTVKMDKASEIQGLESGADDYMTKPFDHDKLLARVKMLLRR